MGYTTITFLIFTLLVIAAYYMFPVKKYQWAVLLAASYVFYLWASWRYVIFILITTSGTCVESWYPGIFEIF